MSRNDEDGLWYNGLSQNQDDSSQRKYKSQHATANGRSFLHQSLTSTPVNFRDSKSAINIHSSDELDSNDTVEATRSQSPPLSLDQHVAPPVSIDSKSNLKNNVRKSYFPRKMWERHLNSFLSKKSRDKTSNQNESSHALSSSNESSTRAGAAFRKIFKRTRKHSRTSSLISLHNSPSNSSLASTLSMDTTLRRGKEKGSHTSLPTYLDTPPHDSTSQASSVSAEITNTNDYHNSPHFYTAPNVTGGTLLLPPLNSKFANNDLDVPLRSGSYRYSKDTKKHWDKDLRKSFTMFHSSNEFGKDSTHAFLGENNSVHGSSFLTDVYNPDIKRYRDFHFGVNQIDPFLHKSLPNQLYSSRHLPPVSESEDCHPARVLYPIEGTGSWDHTGVDIDNGQLIGPAIMSLSPIHVLSTLIDGDHNYSHELGPCRFGRIVLGRATVAQFGPLSNFGWTSALFVLKQNYLLEYDCDMNNIDGKPRGYAHLQYSTVRPHPEFPDALELIMSDNKSVLNRKKTLLIKLESIEERERWVNSLERASNLDINDLYEFGDDVNIIDTDDAAKKIELGKGRYSNVYAAKRKNDPSNNLETENEITESVFTSDDDDFNTTGFNCAIKIISKSLFWERVRERSERVDTLVRETAVHATITAHSKRMRQSSPFLKLHHFFETRESVVLELELLDGTDLFQYIDARGSLLESEAASIMKDILECLLLTERLGVAHRDIKPANILMCNKTDHGAQVKVGDFGMSTFVNVDGLVRGRCGTPGYVAPEIFNATASVGYRNKVDMFSAGVTLYVLLCGYEPFYGETDAELMDTNKAAKIEFIDGDWEHVSNEGKNLVQKMMEMNPADRISVDDALQHPWLLNFKSSSTEYYMQEENIISADESCSIS